MLRPCTCAVVIALITALPAGAQPAEHPPALTPDGGMPVPRAGQATRVHLLGLIELYSIAVYLDGALSDRALLLSPDVAKALRIEVTYRDDLRRRVSLDWRRELVPRLDVAGTAHLGGTFAPLQHGDVVLIEYVPGKGTTVRANKAVAASGVSHELMLVFLDHWLGQRPVSEEIKQELIGSS